MTADVVALCDFYNSPLGKMVQADASPILKSFWGTPRDQTILGLGFAPPFFEDALCRENQAVFFMPAQQGALRWPAQKPALSTLVEETQLPVADQAIDRILCVHSLENCHHVHDFLDEMWRVLKPEGRILFVVPNRRGLWARSDKNPFGFGHPYTMTQLCRLLRTHSLSPVERRRGLYRPPILPLWGKLWEWVARHFLQKFSGLLYVEAEKQVYGPLRDPPLVKKMQLILDTVPLAEQGA